jgi:HAMP domain-containing protein
MDDGGGAGSRGRREEGRPTPPQRLRLLLGRYAHPRLWLDPRRWTLAVRVVVLTILLAAISVMSVGTYLSSVISDGLYEQRRVQVLEESTTIRQDLLDTLNGTAGATSTQSQDAAASFIQGLRSTDSGARRDAALVPVDTTSATSTIASDRAMLDLVGSDMRSSVAESSDSLVWRSVGRTGASGATEPQLLVGTRVVVPGSGTYDLFLLYSLGQEQQTLQFVQRALMGGGAVMLALVMGIAIVVARLVTAPLQRAASAAEKIAAGDLGSRVEATGSDEIAKVGRSFNAMASNLEQKIEDLTELSRVQQRFVSDVSHELRTPADHDPHGDLGARRAPRGTSPPRSPVPPNCSPRRCGASTPCSRTSWRSPASTPAPPCSTPAATTSVTSSCAPPRTRGRSRARAAPCSTSS